MKNPDAKELFVKALRGELGDADRTVFNELISSDAALRAEFEQEQALEQLLDRLPAAPVSSNFTALVLQQVEAEKRQKKREGEGTPFSLPFFRSAFARVAAGIVAVAAIGLATVNYYEKAQRQTLAESAQTFTALASAISSDKARPEQVFQDFDAIQRLSFPAQGDVDLELLVALQK